ncbi:hypothetical protein ACWDXV_20990 [Nocardia nova]|jgi:hypothetical protein|uniref:DUF5666 domain-containing protein n=1 Tax=Nocardia nova TaxID=37330 RepID=A0A2S6A384_9NOCA|nr:hypothetical protein [Nocardia nova]PPI89376.1 hypothetical protein C5E46_33735 [Nocardia nova]PPJ26290.1 hypothetical protein C5F51_21115 [Nocardia nova]
MTEPTPQPPAEPEHTWGAPQTRPAATWSTKKSLAAVGIAAVIAAAGGGVVYAATHSDGSAHGGPGGAGTSWGGGHNTAGPGGMGMTGQSLHGQFVISDGNGGYTTEITQTGTVTAVSDTSITAESADNFTQTYTISGSTQHSAVKVGDTVRIQGTEANGTATATAITSGTESGQMGGRTGRSGRFGGMAQGGDPGQNGPGPGGAAPGQGGGPGMAPPMDGAPNQPNG